LLEQRATWAKIVASGTGSASNSITLVVDRTSLFPFSAGIGH